MGRSGLWSLTVLAIHQIILNLSDIESECFREISFHRYLEKKWGFYCSKSMTSVRPVGNVAWCVAFITANIMLLFQRGTIFYPLNTEKCERRRNICPLWKEKKYLPFVAVASAGVLCCFPSKFLQLFHDHLVHPNNSYLSKLTT